MTIRLQHPIPGASRTDSFGWRAAIPGVIGAQLHNGQDFGAVSGTPIRAAHEGIVRAVWWDMTGGGNMVSIGTAAYSTEYAHMLNRAAVTPGQAVRAGDVIGYVGSTGASTGPHLHFILRLPGGVVDPMPYLSATPTAPEKRNQDMPVIIETDKGDILVVDHSGGTYWNVHEGIPAGLVDTRMNWLKAQGVQQLHGKQPAALLSGYTWAHAAPGAPATVAKLDPGEVDRIAKAVGDGLSARLRE